MPELSVLNQSIAVSDGVTSSENQGGTAPTCDTTRRLDALPAIDYHAREALSASGISRLLRSPAHYRLWRTTPGTQTAAMALGTVVHALVLEPHRPPPVAITPSCERRSNADKAVWTEFEANLQGRVPLRQEEFDRAQRVRDAVYAHAGARMLLENIATEVSIFWQDEAFDIPCKARLDVLRADLGIVDLKTTADAAPSAFARSVANFRYHAQAAHYRNAVQHAEHASPPFFAWIAVETEPPFGCGCYEIDSDGLDEGRRLVRAAAKVYAQALRARRWPGYPETIQLLRLPKWALHSSDAQGVDRD
ncbi:PD-(D/E)XK nuclease-like domain-containing protein [Caballeronia sp. AZ10_KS36]|uniref:PD-(D/E)XK nuclease-like domain-containing protein n=1 Tax=Caballeronia sp. AZ10_KS36 TaxID=2921757 RepID=UPI002028B3F1|nr:PD-(D/E)XK nuclease-like domain-containing protein [Caballeronia sp. AZ10_KS36]